MNIYITEVRAIDPIDNELKTWCGDEIKAISEAEANHILQNTGRGYMKVIGILEAEIPCKNGYEPDLKNMIDYSNYKLN